MQSHANDEIYQRAGKILETYFEEEEDEEAPAVIPELIRRLGADTMEFYESVLREGKKELNWAKLMVVGNGRARHSRA